MESALNTRSNAALQNAQGKGLLETLRARYRRVRIYRETVAELSSLSDRSLADLGLSRTMIRPVAREVSARA
ncbi:DUF1127 domain-containing protein [Tropicimonas sp. IMCC34043]|uniref:DUF1127 domain-containing protein n=1 Tax=Tropicimonas sp. IMCC34043 TaxID=2248760 RepID=UPI000E237048|nr:DUF1127 domain-containing protein [Tropicimonas sp. IMCC34043]